MASFWSGWIIVLTVITLVAMTVLLFGNRKRPQEDPEAKTGHVYDGIEEYDNPLPAWWFWMFTITIIWAVGYLIMYPGMGSYSGLLGWTQTGQHADQVAAADERHRELWDRYLATPIESLAVDPAARKSGQRLFANNCAQCHGSDGKGATGFPNLTDDDWIWGGSADAIKTALLQGRRAAMPPWGQILGEDGVLETTAYVMSLSGRSVDSDQAAAGEKHFQTYCAACHMADGTGNPMLGAPNLTNGIWLYGGDQAAIAQTLRGGRNGNMPKFADSLSEEKIHLLTAYVYGWNKQ